MTPGTALVVYLLGGLMIGTGLVMLGVPLTEAVAGWLLVTGGLLLFGMMVSGPA